MEVKTISAYEPAFRGNLGKNIQKYVNNIVQKEVNSVVNEATSRASRVDVNSIKSIKNLGDQVLDKFSKYAGKMDKKTTLDLNNIDSSYMRFIFSNPIAKDDEIKVYGSVILRNTTLSGKDIAIPFDKDLSKINDATKADLLTLNVIADHIAKLDSNQIDNIFFKSANSNLKYYAEKATGFLSRYRVRKLAKKIDEFAEGLGIDSSARTRVEEYIKIAKESKQNYKAFQKKVRENSKLNQKIADDILKG